MSRDTLAASKAELYGLLWTANAPTFTVSGISANNIHVWDHERSDYPHPFSVTVSTAGMDPDFWFLVVRVYASTAKMDAKTAQDQLDLLVPAVDAKIGSNGGFGPSSWEITYEDSFNPPAFMATCILTVGRATW